MNQILSIHFIHRKSVFFLIVSLMCFSHIASPQRFEHPRGLIKKKDIPQLRVKVREAPYAHMLDGIKYQYQSIYEEGKWRTSSDSWQYAAADLALVSAQVYLLTDEIEWANKSKVIVDQILTDSSSFLNTHDFGLRRAQSVLKVMMAYDYCYSAWGDTYAEHFSEKVYPVIFSLSATMGRSANYTLASNWMGVRYGTLLYSSIIWDDFENGNDIRNSIIAPLTFDAEKRLDDFGIANIHEDGWNVESLGYAGYGWSFVYPALLAWSNKYDLPVSNFDFYDRMIKAFDAAITSYVPIRNISSVGIKPDFSDDGTAMNSRLLPYGYFLAPESDKTRFRKAISLYNQEKNWRSISDGAFENILFTNLEDSLALSPLKSKFFYSPGQGVLVSRNAYNNRNDIIVAFSATANRKGHQGGDNLSFRLIGLDNIWVVGAGRTGLLAGQSTLFPSKPDPQKTRYNPTLGIVDSVYFEGNYSFIKASGSCTGVTNHQRIMKVEMAHSSAEISILDQSEDGKIWRINTPEFNRVEVTKTGFEIIGPNGSILSAKVLTPFSKIETGTNRYGGNTQRHNYGIYFHGKQYMNTTYVDVYCDKNIIVEMVLR